MSSKIILFSLFLASIAQQNAQYVTSNQYSAVYSSKSTNQSSTSQPISNQYQYDAAQNQISSSNPQGVQGYSANGVSSQNSQITQNSASAASSSVSIMDYTFNNGNCEYKDGQVIENGQSRQASEEELTKIQQYRDSVDQYMNEVNGYVGQWINSVFQSLPSTNGSFPNIPTMPTMPQAPCLCSEQNCGNSTATSPQRDYTGNQQTGTTQSMQSQQNGYNQGQTSGNSQYQQTGTTQDMQYQQNGYNQGQTSGNSQYQQNQQYYGRRK